MENTLTGDLRCYIDRVERARSKIKQYEWDCRLHLVQTGLISALLVISLDSFPVAAIFALMALSHFALFCHYDVKLSVAKEHTLHVVMSINGVLDKHKRESDV